MPTESQYRTAADEFRRRANTYRDAAAWAPPHPSTGFTGDGPIADAVDDRFGGALRRLGTAAGELETVASECDRRADVCRGYYAELRAYAALPWHVREYALRPVRPAWWVA